MHELVDLLESLDEVREALAEGSALEDFPELEDLLPLRKELGRLLSLLNALAGAED